MYTAPSVLAQAVDHFTWVLLIDDRTPDWVRDRLGQIAPSAIQLETRGSWDPDVVRAALRGCGWKGGISTRLDSDDLLFPDFVGHIQSSVERHGHGVHTIPFGYQLHGDRLYWRPYFQNPFLTLSDPGGRTAFDFPHWDLRRERVHVASRHPGWVQVLHGGNLANQVRGIRIRGRIVSEQLCRAGIEPPERAMLEAGWIREAGLNVVQMAGALVRATPRLGRVLLSRPVRKARS